MASTQRTASGKWTCRIYIGQEDGKDVYKRFTADTKKEAERMAHLFQANMPKKTQGSDLTVREAITAYINSKANVLSPSTVDGYRKVQRLRLQSIMNVRLSNLTKEQIQIAINLEAAKLSPKSVKNAYGLLTAALSMFGYKDVEVTLPQKIKKEIVIPTDQEMKLLCDSAKKYGIEAEVHVAAYMGLRRSEISAINVKEDVDFSEKTLRISKALVRSENGGYVSKGTKTTSSTRTLSIPNVVLPFFEDLARSERNFRSPDYIEKNFCKMRTDLGMKHITFHSLRHYFASTLVILGIPDFYAMKMMGHSSDIMLKSVYQHVKQSYMKDASKKIDSFFASKNQSHD